MMSCAFNNYNDFCMKQFHPYFDPKGMSYGMGDYYNIPLYKSNKYNIENIIKEPQPESEFFKKKHHSPKKQVRKCSYVIAVIKTDKFIQLGAKEIHNGIYIINKKYTEVDGDQKSAVIGIHKNYVQQLLEPYSEIYQILSSSKELEHISGIKDLFPYKLDALRYMLKFMYFIYDKELLLFTIEPKGDKRLEKKYPTANLCLCGGGLEPSDGQCYEKCARREFLEETGINIPEFGENAKLITKQKYKFQDRQAMHFIIRIN